jgi:hypothetical protein
MLIAICEFLLGQLAKTLADYKLRLAYIII